MKKLMIAAAAAAMIGGVQAKEKPTQSMLVAEYDFVANLQTTQGQSNDKDTLIAHHAVAGQDDWGYMWYEDDQLTFNTNGVVAATGLVNMIDDLGDGGRKWKDAYTNAFQNLVWVKGRSEINGAVYPTIVLRNEEGTILTKDESDLLETIEAHYARQSYGMWCGSWAWYVAEPSRCFRVVGAAAISKKLYMPVTNCCVSANGPRYVFYTSPLFADAAPVIGIGKASDIIDGNGEDGFLNRFGGIGPEWADDLEIYAQVVNVQLDVTGYWFNGWLAGQGYNGKCHADGRTYVAPHQLSGYIVGWTEAPVCPDCCVRPLPKAIAFECLDNPTAYENLPTAAFGSFYIQMTAFDTMPGTWAK